jgi:large subunit ribosomal protein L25
MSEIKLSAQPRTEFGKGAARRIRRANQVPAVVYGHGTDPQHIQLPGHDTMLALKGANALLSISVGDDKPVLALVKDVQRDPVKQVIEHVDLVIVRRGEKVQVDVAVHVVGEAAAETLVTVENATILLEAEATHIPTQVEVSVEGLTAGTQVLAGQLDLPEGSTLAVDDDVLVVNVTAQISEEALEAELAEAEAEAGIEREESDEAIAEAEAEAEAAEGAEGTEGGDQAAEGSSDQD